MLRTKSRHSKLGRGLADQSPSYTHKAMFRKSEAVARLVVGIKAALDHEAQHGPVKVYSAEERAAFAAKRGL